VTGGRRLLFELPPRFEFPLDVEVLALTLKRTFPGSLFPLPVPRLALMLRLALALRFALPFELSFAFLLAGLFLGLFSFELDAELPALLFSVLFPLSAFLFAEFVLDAAWFELVSFSACSRLNWTRSCLRYCSQSYFHSQRFYSQSLY